MKKPTVQSFWKAFNAGKTTRDDLGSFVFEHGLELDDWQLEALEAMLRNAKDQDKMLGHYLRLWMRNDVAEGRIELEQYFGSEAEMNEPW